MVWSSPSGEVLIDIVTRPGQTDHGHGGGLAYGGKPAASAVVQPRAPSPYQYPPLRLHTPGYAYRDGGYSRSGGGEYRGGARMSLLGNYLPPPAPPAHHPPPADPPPYKKIRISSQHHHQLRVDTREPVNTYNTVEVLSPNPPSEPTLEDQSFRTTKDDLLQQISKVDREMALSESTLVKLKKKQEELEQTASKPAKSVEPEEAVPRHRSLAQCVYADNRKKAGAAHALLAHLGPPVLYPLYNQPQDTQVYHENIRRHKGFRKRLAEHIRRVKLEAQKREDALAEAYSRRAAEWLRRVERIEQGQKRKVKDAKNRELFEKVFPELRKQREERERFNRLGARVKSEAELEEIADGLHEQEHEDKKMRSLTVVPPLLRDPSDHTPIYIDTNRRCLDMEAEHAELSVRNVWSNNEREVFREKYLQHPKNFGTISSFLPRKSVRDCVRFYYLSKKAENYKQLLRKPRQRRPPRAQRPQPEPEIVLTPGVTTRLQRREGTGVVTQRSDQKETSADESSQPPTEQPNSPSSTPAPAAPHNAPQSDLNRTPPLPPSPPPASSAPPAPVTATSSSAAASPAAPTPPPQPPDTPLSAGGSAEPCSTDCTTTTSSTATVATVSSPSPSTTPAPAPAPPAAAAPASWAGPSSQPATPQPAQPPTPTQPPPTPEQGEWRYKSKVFYGFMKYGSNLSGFKGYKCDIYERMAETVRTNFS
ncbi:hypothetical protein O0L34_g14941 [Tuta absoluta]|nr:hypothetical protein O0L34_g14941 [Tuta absoluta]